MKLLTAAMEDYLELILTLKEQNKVVRVRDIAKGMNVKMPSVTSMLNNLAKNKLIKHEKYEYVELTPQGSKLAKETARKHTILFEFLRDVLKVDPPQADADACQMEHAVSPTTIGKLVDFIEFVEFCPRAGSDWLEYFKTYCQGEISPEKCSKHMEKFIAKFNNEMEKVDC
ncbi:MAG: metal-dependent transcriptional regulator [Deltaproteobacteria bacterium]|nr:metal-dependent transcriptional regulator [Deltaproteobacteria bacterium]